MKISKQLVDNVICIVVMFICWLVGLYMAMWSF